MLRQWKRFYRIRTQRLDRDLEGAVQAVVRRAGGGACPRGHSWQQGGDAQMRKTHQGANGGDPSGQVRQDRHVGAQT